MRGKGTFGIDSSTTTGITPAYAGKRPFLQDIFPPVPGSPPPMRGKVIRAKEQQAQDRITPAYAGKSSRLPFISTSFQDHPRLCGEKHNLFNWRIGGGGSPPPMRGKGSTRIVCGVLHGITPAYAGKSPQRDAVPRPCGDHPRLCGEKLGVRACVQA